MTYREILSRPQLSRHGGPRKWVHPAHNDIDAAGVSRRQFLYAAASVSACAATLGAPVSRAEAAASAPGIGLVTPIPTTIPVFGVEIHVQAPPFTGADSDPSSVYNFEGTTGIAFISGTVERTDRKTGESRILPYAFNDMRFMQGRFMGRDGHVRNATFAFTWIDVFDPGLGDPPVQIHDFNPGITQNGLFWTSIVPTDRVSVDLSGGRAVLEVSALHMPDYADFPNAVVGGGPRPVPSIVSYRVEWTATGSTSPVDNAAQQFRGEFRNAVAQMAWSARTPDFDFVSAPLASSTTDAAQLGSESNGSFYWRDVTMVYLGGSSAG